MDRETEAFLSAAKAAEGVVMGAACTATTTDEKEKEKEKEAVNPSPPPSPSPSSDAKKMRSHTKNHHHHEGSSSRSNIGSTTNNGATWASRHNDDRKWRSLLLPEEEQQQQKQRQNRPQRRIFPTSAAAGDNHKREPGKHHHQQKYNISGSKHRDQHVHRHHHAPHLQRHRQQHDDKGHQNHHFSSPSRPSPLLQKQLQQQVEPRGDVPTSKEGKPSMEDPESTTAAAAAAVDGGVSSSPPSLPSQTDKKTHHLSTPSPNVSTTAGQRKRDHRRQKRYLAGQSRKSLLNRAFAVVDRYTHEGGKTIDQEVQILTHLLRNSKKEKRRAAQLVRMVLNATLAGVNRLKDVFPTRTTKVDGERKACAALWMLRFRLLEKTERVGLEKKWPHTKEIRRRLAQRLFPDGFGQRRILREGAAVVADERRTDEISETAFALYLCEHEALMLEQLQQQQQQHQQQLSTDGEDKGASNTATLSVDLVVEEVRRSIVAIFSRCTAETSAGDQTPSVGDDEKDAQLLSSSSSRAKNALRRRWLGHMTDRQVLGFAATVVDALKQSSKADDDSTTTSDGLRESIVAHVTKLRDECAMQQGLLEYKLMMRDERNTASKEEKKKKSDVVVEENEKLDERQSAKRDFTSIPSPPSTFDKEVAAEEDDLELPTAALSGRSPFRKGALRVKPLPYLPLPVRRSSSPFWESEEELKEAQEEHNKTEEESLRDAETSEEKEISSSPTIIKERRKEFPSQAAIQHFLFLKATRLESDVLELLMKREQLQQKMAVDDQHAMDDETTQRQTYNHGKKKKKKMVVNSFHSLPLLSKDPLRWILRYSAFRHMLTADQCNALKRRCQSTSQAAADKLHLDAKERRAFLMQQAELMVLEGDFRRPNPKAYHKMGIGKEKWTPLFPSSSSSSGEGECYWERPLQGRTNNHVRPLLASRFSADSNFPNNRSNRLAEITAVRRLLAMKGFAPLLRKFEQQQKEEGLSRFSAAGDKKETVEEVGFLDLPRVLQIRLVHEEKARCLAQLPTVGKQTQKFINNLYESQRRLQVARAVASEGGDLAEKRSECLKKEETRNKVVNDVLIRAGLRKE